jgi:protein gp37
MGDVFEKRRDLDQWRSRLWSLIEQTKNLEWLLLTKRPQNVSALVPWRNSWPDNVWLGTTVENQKYAAQRIPFLAQHPAKVLFLSCEPLLGPIDISEWAGRPINWVIAGGESGGNPRD